MKSGRRPGVAPAKRASRSEPDAGRLRRQFDALDCVDRSAAIATGDVAALAREITEIAAQTLGAERVNVWLFDEGGSELRCIDLFEATPARHSSGTILRESEYGPEFEVLRHARYVDADDPLTDPRTAGYVDSYLRPLNISAMLDAVVRVGEENLGLVCVEHVGRAHRWLDDEIVFACRLADRVAFSLLSHRHGETRARLAASERQLATLMSNLPGMAYRCLNDESWTLLFVSQGCKPLTGFTATELVDEQSVSYAELIEPDDRAMVRAEVAAAVAAGRRFQLTYRIRTATGDTRWVWEQGIGITEPDGGIRYLEGFIADVTDRWQARQQLEDRERYFHTLIEGISDVILIVAGDGRLCYVSAGLERNTDFSRDELLGHSILEFMHPDDAPVALERMRRLATKAGQSARSEYRLRTKGGQWRVWEVVSRNLLDDATVGGIVTTMRDVTERKRTEARLLRVNRALKALSAANAALVHARSEQGLYEDMCRILVGVGGYRLAWIGSAEHDAERRVVPLAHAGHDDGYLASARISWADVDHGRGATGSCIRHGVPQIVRVSDEAAAPWRDEVVKRGDAVSIGLPLKDGDRVFGSLTIHSTEIDAFDDDHEVALLVEMADDLAFGVGALRARSTTETTLQRLEQTMEATVHAIAGTVEMRDPYTAGHQRRVAALSVAIARRLGMDDDQIRGLHLAASIHDLGKINIPAEILSKPGQLTPIELQLVRVHPEMGYEIVRNIDFPWPIAEMIRQHHERLDGSGYPRGLRGDDILPGARIIAVADIVEAMASHRPYRPGLGLDAALKEVSRLRGTALDPAVVDACMQVFNDGQFDFTA